MRRAGREPPLAGGLDRFLIEAERGVERADHSDVAHRAVRLHDALEQHGALNLRAHRLRGVLRLHFMSSLGVSTPLPGRYAPPPVPPPHPGPSPEPCPEPMPVPVPVPAPPPCRCPASRSAARLRSRRQGEVGGRQRLGRNIQVLHGRRRLVLLHFHRRRLHDGHRDLVLAFELGLARRLEGLVAATAAAAAGAGHIEPDDVLIERFWKDRVAAICTDGAIGDEDSERDGRGMHDEATHPELRRLASATAERGREPRPGRRRGCQSFDEASQMYFAPRAQAAQLQKQRQGQRL